MNVFLAKLLLGTAKAVRGQFGGSSTKSIGIRWRRGFFRLWVVGSLLWVAGVAAVDRPLSRDPDPGDWITPPQSQITPPDDLVAPPRGQLIPPDDLVAAPPPPKASNPFDRFDPPNLQSSNAGSLPPLPKGYVLDPIKPAQPSSSFLRKIWSFCLKALGVPVGTMSTWLALAWIVEGFRPGKMVEGDAAQPNP